MIVSIIDLGAALRRTGKRSRALSAAAAMWTHLGSPQLHSRSAKETRRPKAAGVIFMVRVTAWLLTVPVMVSPSKATSVSSARKRLRVKILASNTCSRSSAEYGTGIRQTPMRDNSGLRRKVWPSPRGAGQRVI
jgi:hypothetical protein